MANDVVPYQENDFIFTVAGEELGFIGCAAILLLFALILFRLLMNASQAGNALGRNICYGFFSLIGGLPGNMKLACSLAESIMKEWKTAGKTELSEEGKWKHRS